MMNKRTRISSLSFVFIMFFLIGCGANTDIIENENEWNDANSTVLEYSDPDNDENNNVEVEVPNQNELKVVETELSNKDDILYDQNEEENVEESEDVLRTASGYPIDYEVRKKDISQGVSYYTYTVDYSSAEIGDFITFGTRGPYYFNEYGDNHMIWQVIDKDGSKIKIKLLDEYGRYNQTYPAIFGYQSFGKWSDSVLREYLNGLYLERYFSDEEKNMIVETTHDSLIDSSTDKIFVLNNSEEPMDLHDGKEIFFFVGDSDNPSYNVYNDKGTQMYTFISYLDEGSAKTKSPLKTYSFKDVATREELNGWYWVYPVMWIDTSYTYEYHDEVINNRMVELSDETHQIGDYVTFGRWYFDNTWCSTKPIEWQVVDMEDNGDLVLFSKYYLDVYEYQEGTTATGYSYENGIRIIEDAYQQMLFSPDERNYIKSFQRITTKSQIDYFFTTGEYASILSVDGDETPFLECRQGKKYLKPIIVVDSRAVSSLQ